MKKLVSLLLAWVLGAALAACGAGEAAESPPQSSHTPAAEEPNDEMQASVPGAEAMVEAQAAAQAVLVAYFSRTGSTGEIAEMIQAQVGGDLVRIETAEPYPEEYSEVLEQAREEQAARARPVLTAEIERMEQYDTVFIGYPIWHGDVPMAILSFMEDYDWEGKTVVPFCTHGGGGAYGSFGSVAAAAPGAQVAEGFSVTGSAVDNADEQVAAWLQALGFAEVGAMEESGEDGGKLCLTVGGHTLTATLAENSSAEALRELLATGPVTIDMQDYAGMEKVGDLGATLPANDEAITTAPGDLVLYQGSSFVVYYARNSWSLTRLGTLDDVTEEQLRDILGDGDVSVTLFLDE